MSTTVTEENTAELSEPAVSPVVGWMALLAGLSVVVGGLGGAFWAAVVHLPSYTMLSDNSVVMSERGLTEVVASDVWFVITGVLIGAGLGLVTWKWFRPLGWPTALLAVAAGLLAGVACWQIGQVLGPHDLADRLAVATPGQSIPASLVLRSVLPALAVWGFAAVTPVLLISSLGPDDEEARPRWRRREREPEREPMQENVDERGVLTSSEADTVD